MNEEILKLAEQCGAEIYAETICVNDKDCHDFVEAFYKAAFNAGIAAAADECEQAICECCSTHAEVDLVQEIVKEIVAKEMK